VVIIEQAAEALAFANGPVLTTCALVGEGDDMIESLMITFVHSYQDISPHWFGEKNQRNLSRSVARLIFTNSGSQYEPKILSAPHRLTDGVLLYVA
jgi:hypothetical protein